MSFASYPNESFRQQIGLVVSPTPYHSTREQLLALGYRWLGFANSFDSQPSTEAYQIKAQHQDWHDVMTTTSGATLTASIEAKAFYDTDSSD